MTSRSKVFAAVLLALGVLASTACYGSGTAYVGVYGPAYGPAVYGPGWGGYPYPGRYPPVGGGVWVGVPICCEDEQQDPETPQEREMRIPDA